MEKQTTDSDMRTVVKDDELREEVVVEAAAHSPISNERPEVREAGSTGGGQSAGLTGEQRERAATRVADRNGKQNLEQCYRERNQPE